MATTQDGQQISPTTNLTNPQLPAAGTGVYNHAAEEEAHKRNTQARSSTATAVGNGTSHETQSADHQHGGLATAPTGAPVTTGDGNPRQMVAQPSIFSLGSGPVDGQPIEQPTLLERRESIVIEEQLPDFMKVNEKEHKHRHHYRAALRRRLEIKNNIVAFVSEFVGTVLFLFFAFGIATEAANARASSQNNGAVTSLSQNAPPDTSALLFSSLGFGFSLAVNAWTFYRVSGGLFNPAVTLALFLTGTLGWFQLIHLTIAQIVGAIAASALVQGILPGSLNARTTLANGTTIAQGFWLEFFLTAQLILVIFLLAAEKHRGTFLAPVGIGLALFIAELLGTNYTGGSLNPARTFGPDVVLGTFEGYHWIYWIAPYSAAIVTAGFYQLLKYFQYESANIGQDADESKQVFKDAYGNVIGVLETMAASEFHFIKQEAQPAENEGTVVSNSSHQAGLTAAGMIKKSREEQEKAAAINLAPSEVHNQVA
ncbi:mip family channel protein [Moesziomyces antarcticus]|uniref:Mip family channel protein n=2 Tax=Pseudozyma antarctica TaxID=84753 RepID=A0A081CGX2_PSEA2|nr:mip family channel protein [Moesziomyces antarcticus]GAK65918.1 mip family channel protein [Moesziomyces antarcticus]SPO45552.1 related to aquaporin [Moesziomyces antarcticus]